MKRTEAESQVPAGGWQRPVRTGGIVFEAHSTSIDNEADVASGHEDVELSPRGESQAAALGARRRNSGVEVVYTSDLRRAWRTAEIAFRGTGIAIVHDRRLRECVTMAP
jgi:broad specificity phosphatase PhoE